MFEIVAMILFSLANSQIHNRKRLKWGFRLAGDGGWLTYFRITSEFDLYMNKIV